MQSSPLVNHSCRLRRRIAGFPPAISDQQLSVYLPYEIRETIERELVEYDGLLSAIAALQLHLDQTSPGLDQTLGVIAQEGCLLTNADGFAIAIDIGGEISCRACAGPLSPAIGTPVYPGVGLSGQCLSSGDIIRCDDAETDPRINRECRPTGTRSILVVPVRNNEQVFGIVAAFASRPGAFGTPETRALQMLADITLQYTIMVMAPPSPEPQPAHALPVPPAARCGEQPERVSSEPTPGRTAPSAWRLGRREVQKNLDIMRRDAALRLLGHAKNYLAIETLYDGRDRSEAISLFHQLMFERAGELGVGLDGNL